MRGMNELVNEMSRSYLIKINRLRNVKKRYLSLYRYYVNRLYLLGYLSDPSLVDEKELIRNFVDMDIDIVNVDGWVRLNADTVGMIRSRENINIDSDISEFLCLVERMLYYCEMCEKIDMMYEDLKIAHQSKSSKGKIGFTYWDGGYYPRGWVYMCEGTLECLVSGDKRVVRNGIGGIVQEVFRDMYGVPSLIEGMSYEGERKYIINILKGDYYGKGIINSIREKVLSTLEEDATLWDVVRREKSDIFLKEEASEMEKLLRDGKDIISIDEYDIYTVEDRSTDKRDMIYGIYVLDHENFVMLSNRNLLDGVSGEFIRVDSKICDSNPFVGCPIELVDDSGISGLYVDISQVARFGWKTIFGGEHLSISYDREDMKGNPKLRAGEKEILGGYMDFFNGNFRKTIKTPMSDSEFEKAKNKVGRYL